MENKKINGYEGMFFDENTQKKLVELQEKGLDTNVKDMHITFHFGELDRFPDELMGTDIPVKLVGYASDGKNSGFQVELPEELKQYYNGAKNVHITVSLGEVDGVKGKPVDTGKMDFQPLEEPIEISGQMGYFIFGKGVVMENSGYDLVALQNLQNQEETLRKEIIKRKLQMLREGSNKKVNFSKKELLTLKDILVENGDGNVAIVQHSVDTIEDMDYNEYGDYCETLEYDFDVYSMHFKLGEKYFCAQVGKDEMDGPVCHLIEKQELEIEEEDVTEEGVIYGTWKGTKNLIGDKDITKELDIEKIFGKGLNMNLEELEDEQGKIRKEIIKSKLKMLQKGVTRNADLTEEELGVFRNLLKKNAEEGSAIIQETYEPWNLPLYNRYGDYCETRYIATQYEKMYFKLGDRYYCGGVGIYENADYYKFESSDELNIAEDDVFINKDGEEVGTKIIIGGKDLTKELDIDALFEEKKELSIDEQFAKANDEGYIPAMERLGTELGIEGEDLQAIIENVRFRDRETQGITPEDEARADEMVDALGDLSEKRAYITMNLPDSKVSAVVDRLYDKFENLLLTCDDGQSIFYGEAAIIEALKEQIPEGWTDGKLGESQSYCSNKTVDPQVVKHAVEELVNKAKQNAVGNDTPNGQSSVDEEQR